MLIVDSGSRANQDRKRLSSTALFVAVTFLLASVLVSFGQLGWPGLHWDAVLYGTPVINVASGKGWLFGSYTRLLLEVDSRTYNFHGLLHVLLYGSLLKAGTWSLYLWMQGLFNALTFAVYTAIYAVHLCRLERQGFRPLLSSVLIGCIPALICLGLQGRPEQLAPLILTIPLVTELLSRRSKPRLIAHGVCLGFLTILSPLVGVIFFLYLIGHFYVLHSGSLRPWFRDLALAAAIGTMLLVAILLLFTPFSPLQWAMQIASSRGHPLDFEGIMMAFIARKWGGSFTAPLWGMACFVFLVAGFVSVWRVRKARVLAMLLLIPPALYINQKAVDYTYMPLLPFAIGLCLGNPGQAWQSEWGIRRIPNTLQLGLLSLGSLYLYVLLSYLFISLAAPFNQLSLEKAPASFQSSVAGQELSSGKIAVGYPPLSPSLVVLGNAGLDLISLYSSPAAPSGDIWIDPFEKKTGRRVQYFLLPQQYTVRSPSPPKEIYVGKNRFTLFQNNWIGNPPSVVDRIVRPPTHTDRYNYAVYKRSDA